MNADNDIFPDVEEEEEDAMDCESDSDSSDSTCEISDYPCPFCHTNFINQEEVFEYMEICSGTDPEPEVLKLICPKCQQTFETSDKIEKHIGIHIMGWIRNFYICLNNFNNQEELIGHMNISP